MASTNDFPKPTYITGSCLCGALKYRIDFPKDHDFDKASGTCQCTQCRKNTSSLFYIYHKVPFTAFRWTSPTPCPTLKAYQATPGNSRGFCTSCGSMMYWRTNAGPHISVPIGTVDPLFLFGEGADGVEVPKEGFGMALMRCGGGHEWCGNEIPGVTRKEDISLFKRGEQFLEDD
ncbi:hypothetical protein P152DRAFT_420420 [Eremomyces bilateralis CBS 781.70]|uniref:CENP-V/GFA domain-containing protein n=1 Tax=Eremomyces bilateralis CBS 781.70 TaxID=1392243 RepID=A0A6G1FXN7_9PEZI|nr:uncharacterized protein P152DRAFT_420420 [Eremomyces bilateralis CBS 781.70]KAF1810553.1 hypothetical protein P152DRAFT_420420 [Eremomyces bilateralis CBS 781.70]